jgi:hypothetical protein
LVVCEEGEDLSQVIAANYAFSLRAGLYTVPEVNRHISEQILEHFYDLYDQQIDSPAAILEELKKTLRHMCGSLPIPDGGSVTFITGQLPYGFGFPEAPSTHLFKYPDLGISIINGFSREQRNGDGVGVAVLVDPDTTTATEIEVAAERLSERGVFVRGYTGRGATVRAVTEAIELFPYDFLIIATHCGDASGYRWTYEFVDSEKIPRKLVVDIAVGVAHTDRKDIFNVMQFMRFHSLDGVDWNDPKKSEKLHVGTTMVDFEKALKSGLEPVERETIPRVVRSAALSMCDHNYIAVPRSLANEGTPIILNNACSSWHRLAETFTFSNARAYIGTLFMVTSAEAQEVAVRLLGKHFGKFLPTAVWAAQRDVYGDGPRRPYVITGVYPQRLRVTDQDVPQMIIQSMSKALSVWRRHLTKTNKDRDHNKWTALTEMVAYYERELLHFRARYGSTRQDRAEGPQARRNS